jgi:hypothetical protein
MGVTIRTATEHGHVSKITIRVRLCNRQGRQGKFDRSRDRRYKDRRGERLRRGQHAEVRVGGDEGVVEPVIEEEERAE